MSLPESTQQLIIHFCQAYCPNETEIVLTGSTARGEMSTHSDIDLLVFNPNHNETQIDVPFQDHLFQVSYFNENDSSLPQMRPLINAIGLKMSLFTTEIFASPIIKHRLTNELINFLRTTIRIHL